MFERVLTMTDYYDGPRAGIAELDGVPHFYESEWSNSEDSYTDVFKLSPVPDEILPLALEGWQIWRRWEAAFHQGKTLQETHPALPEDRARHEELAVLLSGRLGVNSARAIRACGTFRRRPDQSESGAGWPLLEVEWTRV
jgi:hypothetical protein